MLTVKNLTISYGRKEVLHQVNFVLEGGQVVCLLGKNGAGKTTLFRSILNTLPYSGEVLVDEIPLKNLSRSEIAKKISYIPQIHSYQLDFSSFEMVLMGTTTGLKTHQQPGKEEEKRAHEAIERLNIAYLADQPFCELSGGEQQLVTIARSVAQNSRVIIMDEPCANLDFGNQIKVLEMIRDLAREGYLILQSTHDPNQALNYSDQILLMQQGKICQGKPKEILTSANLSVLYDLPMEVVTYLQADQAIKFCVPKKRN